MTEAVAARPRFQMFPEVKLPNIGGVIVRIRESGDSQVLSTQDRETKWFMRTAALLGVSPPEAHQLGSVFKETTALFKEENSLVRQAGLRVLARAIRANDLKSAGESVKSMREGMRLEDECRDFAKVIRGRGVELPGFVTEEIMARVARKLVKTLKESTNVGGERVFDFSSETARAALINFARDGQTTRRRALALITTGLLLVTILGLCGKLPSPPKIGGTEMVPVSDKTPGPGVTPEMISIEALIEIDRDGFSKDLRYYADYPEEIIGTEENAGYETFSVSYGLQPEDFYWLRTNPKAGDREIEAYIESKIKQIPGRKILSPQERAELRDKYQE